MTSPSDNWLQTVCRHWERVLLLSIATIVILFAASRLYPQLTAAVWKPSVGSLNFVDTKVVFKFRATLGELFHEEFDWNPTEDPCKWRGITCNAKGTHIVAIRVPRAHTEKHLSIDLSLLESLTTLDISYCGIKGHFPVLPFPLEEFYFEGNEFDSCVMNVEATSILKCQGTLQESTISEKCKYSWVTVELQHHSLCWANAQSETTPPPAHILAVRNARKYEESMVEKRQQAPANGSEPTAPVGLPAAAPAPLGPAPFGIPNAPTGVPPTPVPVGVPNPMGMPAPSPIVVPGGAPTPVFNPTAQPPAPSPQMTNPMLAPIVSPPENGSVPVPIASPNPAPTPTLAPSPPSPAPAPSQPSPSPPPSPTAPVPSSPEIAPTDAPFTISPEWDVPEPSSSPSPAPSGAPTAPGTPTTAPSGQTPSASPTAIALCGRAPSPFTLGWYCNHLDARWHYNGTLIEKTVGIYNYVIVEYDLDVSTIWLNEPSSFVLVWHCILRLDSIVVPVTGPVTSPRDLVTASKACDNIPGASVDLYKVDTKPQTKKSCQKGKSSTTVIERAGTRTLASTVTINNIKCDLWWIILLAVVGFLLLLLLIFILVLCISRSLRRKVMPFSDRKHGSS